MVVFMVKGKDIRHSRRSDAPDNARGRGK
jgi:hypothetical protein